MKNKVIGIELEYQGQIKYVAFIRTTSNPYIMGRHTIRNDYKIGKHSKAVMELIKTYAKAGEVSALVRYLVDSLN